MGTWRIWELVRERDVDKYSGAAGVLVYRWGSRPTGRRRRKAGAESANGTGGGSAGARSPGRPSKGSRVEVKTTVLQSFRGKR